MQYHDGQQLGRTSHCFKPDMDSEAKSSDSKATIIRVRSESLVVDSDLSGDIVIEEPCGACRKAAASSVPLAHWYCQQCDAFLCHDCKSIHSRFRLMENHILSSLHPPCRPCENRNNPVDADYFCYDCSEFVCDECRSCHKLETMMKNHHIVSSQEKVRSENKSTVQPTPTETTGIHDTRGRKSEQNSLYSKSTTQTAIRPTTKNEYQLSTRSDQETRKNKTVIHHSRVPNSPSINSDKNVRSNISDQSSTTKNDQPYVPFNRRTPLLLTTFDVRTPGERAKPSIESCAFLPDSRLLLVDMNNYALKIFDVNLKYVKQVALNFWPEEVNISVYDSNEAALIITRGIIRFSLDRDDMPEKGAIRTRFLCLDGSYISKDKLAVTGVAMTEDNLYIYDITGQLLSKMAIGLGAIPYHIAVDREKSRAYVSSPTSKAVSAIDLNTNKVIFVYKHEDLSWPRRVTIDRDNNIYVCGQYSHNIHQVSPKGEFIRILVSKGDGLEYPKSISFTPSGETFICSCSRRDEKAGFVELYKMA